jgi:hypothetical protein
VIGDGKEGRALKVEVFPLALTFKNTNTEGQINPFSAIGSPSFFLSSLSSLFLSLSNVRSPHRVLGGCRGGGEQEGDCGVPQVARVPQDGTRLRPHASLELCQEYRYTALNVSYINIFIYLKNIEID